MPAIRRRALEKCLRRADKEVSEQETETIERLSVRLGILLILLQSMLLCAEGRAEPMVLQLDAAEKQISALLQDPGSSPSDDGEPQIVSAAYSHSPSPALAMLLTRPSGSFFSHARVAHTIRGPPAR